jgi:putative ABC transport system permease protein
MFDLDLWQEILATIRQNRLRTFLTGFSVAWGIFMLIILMGSGTGLANGIEYSFRDDAVNSIWVRPGEISIPYKGQQPGKPIELTNRDYRDLRLAQDDIQHITSRFYLRGDVQVRYRNETGSFTVRAVHPDHKYLEKTIITRGRFINPFDQKQHRKVAVIGEKVRTALFGAHDPMGQYIDVNGVPFQVVGLFTDEGSDREQELIYLPISTAQRAFAGGNSIDQVMFTIQDTDVTRSKRLVDSVRSDLARRHHFAVDDDRAVFIRNVFEVFERFVNLMQGIRGFIWIVGLGTILAGIVGVSNIMMIVVKERTRELGVRKALGATPLSIIGLILLESIIITATAGYVGLVSGVGLLQLVNQAVPKNEIFMNPQVNFKLAVGATALLAAAGTLAGLIPAWRAARIRPIEALRDE